MKHRVPRIDTPSLLSNKAVTGVSFHCPRSRLFFSMMVLLLTLAAGAMMLPGCGFLDRAASPQMVRTAEGVVLAAEGGATNADVISDGMVELGAAIGFPPLALAGFLFRKLNESKRDFKVLVRNLDTSSTSDGNGGKLVDLSILNHINDAAGINGKIAAIREPRP